MATLPAPSKLKMPPMPTGPLESKPCRSMAYWPLKRDSLPEPQAAVTGLMVIEKVICAVMGLPSESATSMMMLLVVPVAVGVPVIVADGLPGLNCRFAGSAVEPASMVNVYGGTPPLAVMVAL